MPIPLLCAVMGLASGAALAACTRGPDGERPDLVLEPPAIVNVPPPAAVRLQRLFGDERFQRPLDAAQAPGDTRTIFVVEQRGLIYRLIPGITGWVRQPFLDIQESVTRTGNEEGLLGLAFSPHYAEEGHPHRGAFYVNYSVKPGPLSRLSRFTVPAGGSAADPASEEVLLEIPQPYRNHNGGGLLFGPDGMLYYGLGDGGSANDPHGNGQDPGTLLGTILRLDVAPRDDGKPYGIPADNPLLARKGARPEVWAYGLRNPWRFSFDRATGECWVGDVGQNLYEFVHVAKPGGNHGWNLLEGFHRFALPRGGELPDDLVPPVFEYPHLAAVDDEAIAAGRAPDVGDGLSITGGFVYRGQRLPGLVGWYVFADYVTKHVWAIRRTEDGRVEHATLVPDGGLVAAFAQLHDGELLVIDHQGYVCSLVAAEGGKSAEPRGAQAGEPDPPGVSAPPPPGSPR
jgi:glucose/arabinose dehydrogenase